MKVLELMSKIDPELGARLTADTVFQDIIIPSENDIPANWVFPTNLGIPLDMRDPSNMSTYFDANSIRSGWF